MPRSVRFLTTSSLLLILITLLIITQSASVSTALIADTPTPDQTQPSAVEPTLGKWSSEEVKFQADKTSSLPEMGGSLKIDFTVAADQTSLLGTSTLSLSSGESGNPLALGSAWTASIVNNTFSQTAKLPFANLFLMVTWTGEFVSPTEVKGTATIGIGPAVLVSELNWTATKNTDESPETVAPGPTSETLVTGKWKSGDIQVDFTEGPFAGQPGTFQMDFTVNENDENTLGSASLKIAVFAGLGTWNAQRTGGLLSAQFSSAAMDPNASLYASWAGVFTAPDKIEGVAVVGLSPIFFQTIEWSAAPVQK